MTDWGLHKIGAYFNQWYDEPERQSIFFRGRLKHQQDDVLWGSFLSSHWHVDDLQMRSKKKQKILAEPGGTLKSPWYCGMTQRMSGPQGSRQTKRRKICIWVIFPSYYNHIPMFLFLVYQAAASFRPVGSSVLVFIDQWRDWFWGSFGIAKGSLADIQFILGILGRSLAPPMPVLSQPRLASSCWSLLQLHL